MYRNGFETCSTFEKALLVEKNRLNNEWFKDNNPQYYYNFLYFNSGLFGSQVKRYFSLFDKSQFKILTLEELKGNFNDTIIGIWKFLDINNDVKVLQEIRNKGAFTVKSAKVVMACS